MSDGLFDVPGETRSTAGGPVGASAPLACACARRHWTRWSVRTTCWVRARRCADWWRGRGAASSCFTARRAPVRRRSPADLGRNGRRFEALSALSAGRQGGARGHRRGPAPPRPGEQTVLFIDEVHRFSRPSRTRCWRRSRTASCCWWRPPPRTRRSRWFAAVVAVAGPAIAAARRRRHSRPSCVAPSHDPRGLGGKVEVTDDAVDLLVRLSAGDARRALTALEAAADGGRPR